MAEVNQSNVDLTGTLFGREQPGKLRCIVKGGCVQFIRIVDGVEDYLGELYSDDQVALQATADTLLGVK